MADNDFPFPRHALFGVEPEPKPKTVARKLAGRPPRSSGSGMTKTRAQMLGHRTGKEDVRKAAEHATKTGHLGQFATAMGADEFVAMAMQNNTHLEHKCTKKHMFSFYRGYTVGATRAMGDLRAETEANAEAFLLEERAKLVKANP